MKLICLSRAGQVKRRRRKEVEVEVEIASDSGDGGNVKKETRAKVAVVPDEVETSVM